MKRRIGLLFGTAVAAVLLGTVSAAAATEKEFDYHVGDEFLTSLGFPAGDVAKASNGDTITVTGGGQFELLPNQVDGEGTFQHKDTNGNLLVSGTWEATKLLSFVNFNPGGSSGFPPDFRGGSAVIQVHLVGHPASDPSVTLQVDATLRVDCAIAGPTGFTEGITLQTPLTTFDQKVSGVTLFVFTDTQ